MRPGATSMGLTRGSTWRIAGGVFMALLVLGYAWSFVNRDQLRTSAAGGEVGALGAALTSTSAPNVAFLTDAALDALADRMLAKQRGLSGKLRVSFQTSGGVQPDTMPQGAELRYAQGADTIAQPSKTGVWNLLLSMGNALSPSRTSPSSPCCRSPRSRATGSAAT